MRKFLGTLVLCIVVAALMTSTLLNSGKFDVLVDFTRTVFGQSVADGLAGWGDSVKGVSSGKTDPIKDLAKSVREALEDLGELTATSNERIPDYRRDRFGPAWADTDKNGCDTRNDILARDLTDITVDKRCRVLTGVLNDPYTGKTINFVRGETTSQAVQIDHVVPLSQAWKSGAWRWDDAAREAFANDPLNLLAVDGPTNNAKGGRGPSQWLPPQKSAHCDYAKTYVAVSTKYDLTVSEADRKTLTSILSSCG